jgi:hypothetical protein
MEDKQDGLKSYQDMILLLSIILANVTLLIVY